MKRTQANKTAQKQPPNKLKDLFGNYEPLMGDSITEHDVMNDPQNVSN